MPPLRRVLGTPGAVLTGLGSIVGTGVFVSLGLAAGIAGPAVILAVVAAAVVATFNGLSSARLAASHPVSGGSYEYGYRYLNPTLGFVAGWTFLCAKSASAATAALGFAGYLCAALPGIPPAFPRAALAAVVVAIVTAIVAGGMQRSQRFNAVVVTSTLTALLLFVVTLAPTAAAPDARADLFRLPDSPRDFLHATALMFVAYTGYGRIATLGEEVRDPARTIPRAIVITLVVAMLLYTAVVVTAVAVAGAAGLADLTRTTTAPLEETARLAGKPWLAWAVSVGAMTAMLGVLLNLILGLSRVYLAMARRRDMPVALASVDAQGSPRRAVLATGAVVLVIVLALDLSTSWSFSAFSVLVYYAITNLAASRLPGARVTAAAGLISCLGLAFWVEPRIWLAGLAMIAVGLAMRGYQGWGLRRTAPPR